MSRIISDKKKALQAHKERLLEEIQYYDKRIEEFHSKGNESLLQDQCSSDSDEDFPINIDHGLPMSQLKLEQSVLKTRLQATQELTNLQVLQSEVKVLTTDPEIIGEPSVTEEGVWREVTAECRVDLVPFTITFYVHKPNRKFGANSYRGVRVTAVKAAHETELTRSVLGSVRHPSDAVEVLKSYSVAHRSRRTTLARLAEKYANSLFMEPMSDGGYTLKCADLLEVSWTLQNKSAVAPFQHRMRFDLEYMDESYIKTISHVHRQLSDPTISTDERTLLLAKIINIVLEAKGPTQELYESMESDPDTASKLRKRRTTLDQGPEESVEKKKDNEVMAPPKSLPKKVKKSKNNPKEGNTSDSDTKSDKTAANKEDRAGKDKDEKMFDNSKDIAKNTQKNIDAHKTKDNKGAGKGKKANDDNVEICAGKAVEKDVAKSKGKENKNANTKTVMVSKKRDNEKGDNILETDASKSKKSNKESKEGKAKKTVKNADNLKETEKMAVNDNIADKDRKPDKNIVKKPVKRVNSGTQVKITSAKKLKTSNILQNNINDDENTNLKANTEVVTKSLGINKKTDNINKKMPKKDNKINDNVEKSNSDGIKKSTKDINTDPNSKNDNTIQKFTEKNKSVPTKSKTADAKKTTDKHIDNIKKKLPEVIKKKSDNTIKTKSEQDKNEIDKNIVANSKNANTKIIEKAKNVAAKNINKIIQKTDGNRKNILNNKINKNERGNIKNNIDSFKKVLNQNRLTSNNRVLTSIGNSVVKNTKIPQKSQVAQGFMKKNQLRISPRKTPSKFKTASMQKLNRMSAQKPITNIPRLLKKPLTKS